GLNDAIFNTILTVLRFLSKIPILGKVFRPLLYATNLLKKISKFIPVVFIILIWFLINIFYVNSSETHELPDNGKVKIYNMSFDTNDNVLHADVENTGDVIADVRSEYSVVSTQFSWNPVKWFLPTEVTQCEAD